MVLGMMKLSEPVENEGFEEEFWGDFLDFLDEEDGDFGEGSITCLVIFFLDLHMKELEAFKKRKREIGRRVLQTENGSGACGDDDGGGAGEVRRRRLIEEVVFSGGGLEAFSEVFFCEMCR